LAHVRGRMCHPSSARLKARCSPGGWGRDITCSFRANAARGAGDASGAPRIVGNMEASPAPPRDGAVMDFKAGVNCRHWPELAFALLIKPATER